jgi:hemolysin activation/secretion protein
MSTGWIAKPFIDYGYYKNKSTTIDPMDSNSVAVGTTFTYKWMSDNGFNWQLGVGAFYSSVKSLSLQDKDGHKGVGLIGEFSMGMAL